MQSLSFICIFPLFFTNFLSLSLSLWITDLILFLCGQTKMECWLQVSNGQLVVGSVVLQLNGQRPPGSIGPLHRTNGVSRFSVNSPVEVIGNYSQKCC